MNIAYLAKEYPPYGLSFSPARFYADLAEALVAKGHQVHVVSQAVRGNEDYIDDAGVHIHRVGPRPKAGSASTRLIYNFNAWRKLRELTRQHNIEIVDTQVTFAEGFFPSLRKQVPLVLQTHSWSDMFLRTKSYDSPLELLSLKVSAYLENISLRRADRIIANSHQSWCYVIEQGIPRERVILIPLTKVTLRDFRFLPSDIRARLGIPRDAALILYVGWLQARKGLHILAQALPQVLARCSGAFFVFLGRDTLSAPGGGSFKQFLLSCALKSGASMNVKIIEDFLPDEDLVRLYSACDVFVLPSLSESFGAPVIEAMACGRAVIATATGIAPELEGASPVFLVVPPGDPGALAQAIVKVLSIPREEREALAAGHRQIVEERFSFERMVDEILRVYAEVIAERERK